MRNDTSAESSTAVPAAPVYFASLVELGRGRLWLGLPAGYMPSQDHDFASFANSEFTFANNLRLNNYALGLRQPPGSAIYFAIDYDAPVAEHLWFCSGLFFGALTKGYTAPEAHISPCGHRALSSNSRGWRDRPYCLEAIPIRHGMFTKLSVQLSCVD